MASNNRICFLALMLTVSLCVNPLHATISGFVETFDGNGPFTSFSGLSGLDNDGWNVPPSGLVDGGLEISIEGPPNQQGLTAAIVYRPITGMGSFVERVELSNVEMYIEPFNFRGVSQVRLSHGLAPAQSMTGVYLTHIDRTNENGGMLPEVPYWSLVSHRNGFERVPAVQSFALEHHFDYPRSEVSSVYEVNVDGEIQRYTIGPIEIDDPVSINQQSYFEVTAAFEATSKARIDHWSLMPLFDPGQGDFDENSVLDVADIGLLLVIFVFASNKHLHEI